jgi:phosphate transport system protein
VQHFFDELDDLNALLLQMCALVEESIHGSVSAVVNRDAQAARKVFEHETSINQLEMMIDNTALRLLALQQPVAVDLRFVTMSMKINNNLERMGDIAVNIAQRAITLLNPPSVIPRIDIPLMSRLAEDMIRASIDAFIRRDPDLAKRVLGSDDAVDHLRDDMYQEIVKYMEEDVRRIHPGIDYMFVARGLERLADHATNIAEDVLFFVQGVDVRHHNRAEPETAL